MFQVFEAVEHSRRQLLKWGVGHDQLVQAPQTGEVPALQRRKVGAIGRRGTRHGLGAPGGRRIHCALGGFGEPSGAAGLARGEPVFPDALAGLWSVEGSQPGLGRLSQSELQGHDPVQMRVLDRGATLDARLLHDRARDRRRAVANPLRDLEDDPRQRAKLVPGAGGGGIEGQREDLPGGFDVVVVGDLNLDGGFRAPGPDLDRTARSTRKILRARVGGARVVIDTERIGDGDRESAVAPRARGPPPPCRFPVSARRFRRVRPRAGAGTATANACWAAKPPGSVAVTTMVAVPTETAVIVRTLPDTETETTVALEVAAW